MIEYNVESLVEEHLKRELLTLAEYHKVDVKQQWNKEKIAEAIVDKVTPEMNDPEPQRSVRIQRIYDQHVRR